MNDRVLSQEAKAKMRPMLRSDGAGFSGDVDGLTNRLGAVL
jgi:hypothetical protein